MSRFERLLTSITAVVTISLVAVSMTFASPKAFIAPAEASACHTHWYISQTPPQVPHISAPSGHKAYKISANWANYRLYVKLDGVWYSWGGWKTVYCG